MRTLEQELLVDLLVETSYLTRLDTEDPLAEREDYTEVFTVLRKPGVMDPVSQSVLEAAADLGYPLEGVRTFRRYFAGPALTPADLDILLRKVLANDAIEQVVRGPLHVGHLTPHGEYALKLLTVPCAISTISRLRRSARKVGWLSI